MEKRMKLIAKRLEILRKEKGMTQAEASEYVGAGTGTWQQWELGKRMPKGTAIIAIAARFNVSVEYVEGSGEDRTPELLCIPKEQLEPGDEKVIQDYLQFAPEEKEYLRTTINFIQGHRH